MIDINISSKAPEIEANLTSNSPEITGNLETGGLDTSNLRIRVTNLENTAIGGINVIYDEESSVLSITTENTKGESIGTARNVNLPAGLENVSYNEEQKRLVISLTNNTTIDVSLKESFDKIDRYLLNLQQQIDSLDAKKLDKVAYLSASDIDDYFEE